MPELSEIVPRLWPVAKEAVSAAMQTGTRQQSERICELIDAPRTKPRPCVKIMLADSEACLLYTSDAADE